MDIVTRPESGEIESLVALGQDKPVTITHTIHQMADCIRESSFTPYIYNMHEYDGAGEIYKLLFPGNHKIDIDENEQVVSHIGEPVYVCQNKDGKI